MLEQRHLGRDPKPQSLIPANAITLSRWVWRTNHPKPGVGEFRIGSIYLNLVGV
ncbi:uncharacterized protein METZ01_LOCUS371570 [marine metagenome]|uniref:Uncharacterized protein n=1 Tax=marine metagenome TaxID=408172 RepID=A0A382T9G8_9ZZZZ